MTPTRGNEEIEGRSYKDYAYSPVPVSSPSAVYDTDSTPDRESVELNVRGRTSLDIVGNPSSPENMTEKGSKRMQYLAAAAGKFASVDKGLNSKGERNQINPLSKCCFYRSFGLFNIYFANICFFKTIQLERLIQ